MAHGHPIAREMESWWREHGGRTDDPAWIAYVNDFGSLLIDKLVEISEEHDNEGRFGMSKAGGCTRAVALKFLGHESELTGSTRATFAIGHILEVKAIATIRAIGYVVRDLQKRVRIDPFMSSSIDGVIEMDRPSVLSVKSIGYKMSGKRYGKGGVTWTRHGLAALPANGFKAEQPGHWAQIQAEMHASGHGAGLIVYVAKDMVKAMENDPVMIENGSLTFYAESVEYDDVFCSIANPLWQTQWDAAQDGDAGPAFFYTSAGAWTQLDPHDDDTNKAATGTYSPCAYCDLRAACTTAQPLAESIRRSA